MFKKFKVYFNNIVIEDRELNRKERIDILKTSNPLAFKCVLRFAIISWGLYEKPPVELFQPYEKNNTLFPYKIESNFYDSDNAHRIYSTERVPAFHGHTLLQVVEYSKMYPGSFSNILFQTKEREWCSMLAFRDLVRKKQELFPDPF